MTTTKMPTLLLHGCCGPCSTHVIRLLQQEFTVAVWFYNPNIYPEEEYKLRLQTLRQFVNQIDIPLLIGPYDIDIWHQAIHGYETMPEGSQRCTICYQVRLEQTAKYAHEADFDYFATTLTISPHKPVGIINQIGLACAEKYAISFYPADFKKKDGFKLSCALTKQYQLYRQNYCGCKYSLLQRGNGYVK